MGGRLEVFRLQKGTVIYSNGRLTVISVSTVSWLPSPMTKPKEDGRPSRELPMLAVLNVTDEKCQD